METLFKLNKEQPNETKSSSHIKQAEQIWSMLDDMALSSPDSYKLN